VHVNTPAPWITAEDLGVVSSPEVDEAIAGATFVLWMLSARKYGGVRTTTEIYCQTGLNYLGSTVLPTTMRATMMSGSGMQVHPMLREGVITNEILGMCGTCGCEHAIRLRGVPVRSVHEIWHGNQQIDMSTVAIYDHSYITAPNRCWGTCDDLEVTYTYGTEPPALGKMAARELATQYLLAMSEDEDGECALPRRVTQVSRQGVSWTLLDPQDFLDHGRTGIYLVDLFLRTVNPDRARLRARVFSPDLHRARSYREGPFPPPPVQQRTSPEVVAAPTPQLMTPTITETATRVSPPGAVTVYTGQPLRWLVPGAFTEGEPPVITVRPSGEEVPPDTLSWRSGNYTLDLSNAQAERLLPHGSVLVVSTPADDGSTRQTSHPVERRTT
jgi:hypothetical protein